LAKYPKTYVLYAQVDTLRDQGILFAEKLVRLKKDVQIKEYRLLPHGVLNFTFPIWGIKEAEQIVNLHLTYLSTLLEMPAPAKSVKIHEIN
jgi:acetyl esterase/lipase